MHGKQEWQPGNAAGEERERRSSDAVLETADIQIERKTFMIQRRTNPRGTFVRIEEQSGERRSSVCVPESGLAAFIEVLQGL